MPTSDPRTYFAGHRGRVGTAILRALNARGGTQIITRTHAELDLTDQTAVDRCFAAERPQHIDLAAAKVGGVGKPRSDP